MYTIRFFTVSPISTLIPLQAQLFQEGVVVQLHGMQELSISYDEQRAPLQLEVSDSANPFTILEIAEFRAWVKKSTEAGRDLVLHLLEEVESIILIRVPDDFQAQDLLDFVITLLNDLGEGMYHVEGEGFYQGNELIVKL